MARKGRQRKAKKFKMPQRFNPPTFEERVQEELAKKNAPNRSVIERRLTFAGIAEPPAGVDIRNHEIDSEVYDAIGQLCALGFLDGHGHDPKELRDKGRFWGLQYTRIMGRMGEQAGNIEPRMHYGTGGRGAMYVNDGPYTGADMLFDRMDENLPAYERARLLELIVEPLIGEAPTVPWAQALIDMALLERKRLPENRVVKFPTLADREFLNAAIRGLVILVDGSLPSRWQERRVA